MPETEKITIIEGPTPTFEAVSDAWLLGLTEGLEASQVVVCRLRTFNGPALVERCYRAWRAGQTIRLEYRAEDGLARQAPIVATRWMEQDEGHLLVLWVRMDEGEIEVEMDVDLGNDDFDEDVGDELDGPDTDLTL